MSAAESRAQAVPAHAAEGVILCGVGASAGSLNALRALLSAVGAPQNLSLVIAQHKAELEPSHVSVLAKMTPLAVRVCEDGMPIEPGFAYVAPPDAVVGVDGGAFSIRPLRLRPRRPRAIDHLFTAIARHFRERSAGVILSGRGDDGTRGLEAIAEAGGLTLAQSEETASHTGMPASAAAFGVADVVGAPDALAAALVEFAAGPRPPRLSFRVLGKQELLEVCAQLREVTGLDFRHYKETTLSRRILRRVNVLRLPSLDAYIEHLERHHEEARLLMRDLLLGVTGFFRDPDAFVALRKRALESIIRRDRAGPVRIWIPGCGTGQEAYTIAMLAQEVKEACGSRQELQIFATDVNERALSLARRGSFPPSTAEEVDPIRLARWFERFGRRYRVTKELRQLVVFSPHNLIADPPFSRMDLISCRNLLIYLGPPLQKKLVGVFHYALREGGYLFLGGSETVSGHSDLFRVVDGRNRIAQRKETVVRDAAVAHPLGPSESGVWHAAQSERPADLGAIAQRILLDEFAPPYAIASNDGQILFLSARTGRFLQPPEGRYVNHLLRMARMGLRAGLRSAWTRATTTLRTAVYEGLFVDADNGRRHVRITVQPMPELGEDATTYMVVFEDMGSAEARDATAPSPESERVIEQLEAELVRTREELERAVQDLEAANEELKSSNEELLSMNEELQSANEELETSKEEVEVAKRSLEETNADLSNLLRSTEIATIFLDCEGAIRNFTPAAMELYNFGPQDLGRPLAHFTHQFETLPPLPSLQELIEGSAATACEATLRDGSVFLRRSTPYRTADGQPSGLVVTFVNVTASKETERRLRESQNLLRGMLDHSKSYVFAKDLDGRYMLANRHYLKLFDETLEGVIGKTDYERFGDIGLTYWENDRRVIETGAPEEFVEDAVGADGRRHFAISTKFPLLDADGTVIGVGCIATDVTDRRAAEEALKVSEARYRAVVENQSEMICRFRPDGEILFVNAAYARTQGKVPEELIGRNFWAFVPKEEHAPLRAMLASLSPESPKVRVENRFRTSDGEKWTLWTNQALAFDEAGNCTEAQSTGIDITERKEQEQRTRLLLHELNHRVKNNMAIVQSLARQTLRDPALKQARDAFLGRLRALGDSHALLTRETWDSLRIGDLVDSAVAACGVDPARFDIEGPVVSLPPQKGVALGMALHELCTNAIKYGALSNEVGHVLVRWGAKSEELIWFRWREVDGPPVEAPRTRGFGSAMIEKALASDLSGSARLAFAPEGLVCEIEIAV